MITYVDEGLVAYESGERRDACPYITDSDAAMWWLSGWDYAANHHDQLELLHA